MSEFATKTNGHDLVKNGEGDRRRHLEGRDRGLRESRPRRVSLEKKRVGSRASCSSASVQPWLASDYKPAFESSASASSTRIFVTGGGKTQEKKESSFRVHM